MLRILAALACPGYRSSGRQGRKAARPVVDGAPSFLADVLRGATPRVAPRRAWFLRNLRFTGGLPPFTRFEEKSRMPHFLATRASRLPHASAAVLAAVLTLSA